MYQNFETIEKVHELLFFYFTFQRVRSELRENVRVSARVFDIKSQCYCLVYIVSRLVQIAIVDMKGKGCLLVSCPWTSSGSTSILISVSDISDQNED